MRVSWVADTTRLKWFRVDKPYTSETDVDRPSTSESEQTRNQIELTETSAVSATQETRKQSKDPTRHEPKVCGMQVRHLPIGSRFSHGADKTWPVRAKWRRASVGPLENLHHHNNMQHIDALQSHNFSQCVNFVLAWVSIVHAHVNHSQMVCWPNSDSVWWRYQLNTNWWSLGNTAMQVVPPGGQSWKFKVKRQLDLKTL